VLHRSPSVPVKPTSSLRCQRILLASHLQTLSLRDYDVPSLQTHLMLRPPEALRHSKSLTAPASLGLI
jgi:hypothetical protein